MSEELSTEVAGLTLAVAKWKYDKSVEKMRVTISKWHGATTAVMRELFLAREYLNNQKGQRKDPDAPDYIRYTWDDYCNTIGISRQTANAWLRAFTPAELSDDGFDHWAFGPSQETKQIAALREKPTRKMEARIAQVLAGGVRPDDWTREEEKILKERVYNAKIDKVASIWIDQRFDVTPQRDYFNEILSKTKSIKRFKLKTNEQHQAQMAMFSALDEYLRLFPDMESRLVAAANLSARIHDVANYLVEYDIIQQESTEA